jgi:hypothetical protein
MNIDGQVNACMLMNARDIREFCRSMSQLQGAVCKGRIANSAQGQRGGLVAGVFLHVFITKGAIYNKGSGERT